MRTEELINEAQAFARDCSAYIHCEIFNGERGAGIITGDDKALLVAVFGIIEALAEQAAKGFPARKNKEINKIIKSIKALQKKGLAMGRSVFETVCCEEVQDVHTD